MEMIMLNLYGFYGEHFVFTDKSLDLHFNIKNLVIKDLENNKNTIMLSSINEAKNQKGEFEDRMNLVLFRKKDSYISIGTKANWYVVDYFELSVLPIIINISKENCEFFYDFFFSYDSNHKMETEEDYKVLLLSSSKYQNRKEARKEKNLKNEKESNIDNPEEEYPVYYKQVKINDIEMILSFVYSLESNWGVNNHS